ncbi:hypothetical protein E4U21_007715 [Claviceps maximensis]|nr:hypothetical protein E4U21_007715 [Claviceps maximensis]
MNHAAPSRSIAAPDDAAVALRGASLAFQRNAVAGSAVTLALTTSSPEQPSSSSSSITSTTSSTSHPSKGVSSTANINCNRSGSSRHGMGAADCHKNGHLSHHTDAAHPSGSFPASLGAARLHELNGSSYLQQQQQQSLMSTSSQWPDPKNPSFIAATLAAGRNASPSPLAPRHQNTSPFGPAAETTVSPSGDGVVDSDSIPATGKLISLFENGGGAGSSRRQSLDVRDERLPDEKRRHVRTSSATSFKSRPAVKPKPKPKPKPSSASRQPSSPSPPLSGTPAETLPAAEVGVQVEAETRRTDAVPSSSRPPPHPKRSVERSSEKISAMPMPKPKLPPHLSLPFPHAAGHNPHNHQQQAQLPPPPSSLPTCANPGPSRKSPSPSRREQSAVQPPRTSSITSAFATPEVLSPKPTRLVRPVLAPPGLSTPSSKLQKNGSGGRNQGTASSPSRDAEIRGASSHSRTSSPPKSRISQQQQQQQQQQQMAAGTSQKSRSWLHHEDSDAVTSHSTFTASSSSRTEFGLPIVPYTSAPAPAPPPPRKAVRRKLPPPPLSRSRRRGSVASAPTSPVLAPQSSGRRLTITSGNTNNNSNSNLPLDTLTNAIMASSLASAKLTPHNTGSSLPPPSLPQRQRSPRLLQTLRQTTSYQDDDPERIKIAHRHKLSSNKHAHREGARRRWRDQVTQKERKRYEAVWASNRGYSVFPHEHTHSHGHSSPPDRSRSSGLDKAPEESECVFNVVVREIWKRSRLPQDELVEVWELVDGGHKGMLTRQEFVVGMWLIDQRLKGRKIPTRVSDSVWDSVNGVRPFRPRRK